MPNFINSADPKVELQLKVAEDTFTDQATGQKRTYSYFYVIVPSLPNIKLKLKANDTTCKQILQEALGIKLAD